MPLHQWIWKIVNCRSGRHWDENGTANFCGACGKLLNPAAFSDYLVTLNDGTEKTVTAINQMHAQSLLIYGDELKIDSETGQPIEKQLIHPDNIKSVKQI